MLILTLEHAQMYFHTSHALQTVGIPIGCSRAHDCTQDCLSPRDEPVQQVLTVVGLHLVQAREAKVKKKILQI